MADLRVDNVSKRYGRVTALDGMSFEIASGEFFCLLGPSSSGKTTTLRAIAGLERLQGGHILFDGEDITTAPVQGRDMAMIFQTFALYPHLTIRQNFSYPLQRGGTPRAEIRKRVGEIAELLRVAHTLERKPDTLSGGEQQRVAIGRALIRRPRLLLLDEPLTNLDAKLRHDTRAEFKRLHRELGMTMLYATPDQLEALTMGERIAVIKEGRVVQIDAPRALYGKPQDTYVAGMVGAPAMNLVPGKLRRQDGRTMIALDFAELPAPDDLAELPEGGRVIVGVRPHDVLLDDERHEGDAGAGGRYRRVPAKVFLSEPLGDVTILDLKLKDDELKMVLPEDKAAAIEVGSEIDVAIDTRSIHLFYAETGVRIH